MSYEALLPEILAHAESQRPREACGLIVNVAGVSVYKPCRNIATEVSEFIIDPPDYAQAEDSGQVVMVVHSHVGISPEPSMADLTSCEASGLPWLIVSVPLGSHKVIAPTGYRAPLYGRPFCYGVLDCYTLICDYYKERLGIELPWFESEYGWWLRGENLYEENFERAGFRQVDIRDIKLHDVVLMQIRADVINHAAVYVGDGKVMQHCIGHLSADTVYGGWWSKVTRCVVRHKDL